MAILIPMCRRTNRFLVPADEVRPGNWRCDGRMCKGKPHEYALDYPFARESVDRAAAYAARRFSVEPPSITVWWSPGASEPPNTTRGLDGGIAIYLNATTVEQSRFQAGHEVFHAFFTPINTHHWLHETLATVLSLEFLSADGLNEHRQKQVNEDDRHRPALSLAQLVGTDGMPYPPGLYERASVFGRDLARIVGSDVVFEARNHWVDANRPDYWGWVDSLPTRVRKRVARISPSRDQTR